MYQNSLVSVVIPIYNSEKHISETLDSVINQTYMHIEMILVDDSSTDNSVQIIEDYMRKNPEKINLVKFDRNMGVAIARNQGIRQAKGRYIAFLDSDDIWYNTKISKQIDFMTKNNYAFCFSALEVIGESGNLIKVKREVPQVVDYHTLLRNTVIATSSVIIDRDSFGSFEMPHIRSGQDYATWLKLLKTGNNAYGINEVLVKYRVRSNSLSKNKFQSVKQVYMIQRRYEKISIIKACFNTLNFAYNAFRKHYM